MLFKSLEFINVVGQKVKVIEIPVLEEDNPYNFMLQLRLQNYIAYVYGANKPIKVYSFREHLKRVLKWPVYEELYKISELKNNA